MNFVITRSLAAAVFALTLATAQAAAPRYQLTDLGTLGGRDSFAAAVNRSGLIVGNSATTENYWPRRAFAYVGGVMSDLGALRDDGDSQANAVNDAGTACGEAWSADSIPYRAVIFEGGQVLDIGGLRSDWEYSTASGINRAGHVVGFGTYGDRHSRGYIYRHGQFEDLPEDTYAGAINDQDQVTVSRDFKAFLFDHGQMIDLGTLGGSFSQGAALNQAGEVTGVAMTGNGEYHGFVSRNGNMTDLGTLGGPVSVGVAIDDHGVVVGWSRTHRKQVRGFVTVHGKMTNLNVLLDPVSRAGWTITGANAIGRHGEILADGYPRGARKNDAHAVLLTPMAP